MRGNLPWTSVLQGARSRANAAAAGREDEFYKKMLEPLGIDMPYKFDHLHGFAINSNPGFWLKNGEVAKDLYVAFTAKSADAVSASHRAAIDAGGTSNKEPSLRPEWRADYL